MVTGERRPVRNPGLEQKTVGEEVVLFDSASSKVHVLNEVAALIFSLCDGTRSPSDIACHIANRYGADPQRVENDVNRALAKLEDEGILARSEAQSEGEETITA